uniref:tyrosine-type recombinase/integrase n=1 Tax=Agathobacter sp. TaxID=2021311 RepID=UPI0040572D7A
MIEVAVEDGYIRNNISDNALKELKQAHNFGKTHKRALTVAEQDLFMEFLKREDTVYHHWCPIFTTMINIGMRVGEVTGLTWDDINWEEGIITVNRTFVYYSHANDQGCYFNVHEPKTEAGKRTMPMLEEVKE